MTFILHLTLCLWISL